MKSSTDVVSAFSEEQTSRLTGVSLAQLRYWDRTGFYRPAYAEENRRIPFSRIYSFNDIVALRVLNTLRNDLGVSLPHLREVSQKLSFLSKDRWTGVQLWVLSKRVVWQEPGTELPQELLSRQYVAPAIVLNDVATATKKSIASFLHDRSGDAIGRIERNRHISHNAPVIAGTRIPVATIKRFHEAGYSINGIIAEYPDLTPKDVQAALDYDNASRAA